jgi:hypothetical protein
MALAGRPRGKRSVLKQNPSGLSPHMRNDDGFRFALPILYPFERPALVWRCRLVARADPPGAA